MMTKKKLLLKAMAMAGAIMAGQGAAQAAAHDLKTFIREQDLDGDGKVSKEEFARGRDDEFVRMDRDHDGKLSHDEYVGDYRARLERQLLDLPAGQRDEERARELKQADVRFGVLDSDHDGSISKAEFAASGWGMFLRHDTNRDGFVSAADAVDTVGQ